MTVTSKGLAWIEADKIFPTDYLYDSMKSHNAGYDIYSSTAEGVNAYICDLGDRLEVNLPDGKSVNIWIKGYDESDLAEALCVLDNAEYQIEDKLNPRLREMIGLDTILKDIDKSFKAIRKLLKENFPDSNLIKSYDLDALSE